MPELMYLTRSEFIEWAQRFESKLDKVIERDGDQAIKLEGRLMFLETYQKQSSGRVSRLSTAVSSLVVGFVLSLAAWWMNK